MASLKIYYDSEGKTVTVWFDVPEKEHVAEETGDEVILIKDREGRVIGFERLNFTVSDYQPLTVETVAALRLGRYFGVSPEIWINLQADYELRVTMRDSGKEIETRVRPFRAAS